LALIVATGGKSAKPEHYQAAPYLRISAEADLRYRCWFNIAAGPREVGAAPAAEAKGVQQWRPVFTMA